ncbi:hypothetical protein PAL_GLEAN10015843, partial [Pteropus alecto]
CDLEANSCGWFQAISGDHFDWVWSSRSNLLCNQGGQWPQAAVQLGRLTQPFHRSLEKVSLGIYDGVSAVSGISFENCTLPLPMESCKGPHCFWCRHTKACIEELRLCGLIDVCGDYTDEVDCDDRCPYETHILKETVRQRCKCKFLQSKGSDVLTQHGSIEEAMDVRSFEKGSLREWYQAIPENLIQDSNTFQWGLGHETSIHHGEENHRPSVDHTKSTTDGLYLYVDSSNWKSGDMADILTPVISRTGSKCTLVFWTHVNGATVCSLQIIFHYHVYGNGIGALTLIPVSNQTKVLFNLTVERDNFWQKKELFLSGDENFQLQGEGGAGKGHRSDIALDDVVLTKSGLPSRHSTKGELTVPLPTGRKHPARSVNLHTVKYFAQVYTIEESGLNILTWSVIDTRTSWMYGQEHLSRNSFFKVAFEADLSGSEDIFIALDDISFPPECVSGGKRTMARVQFSDDGYKSTLFLCTGEAYLVRSKSCHSTRHYLGKLIGFLVSTRASTSLSRGNAVDRKIAQTDQMKWIVLSAFLLSSAVKRNSNAPPTSVSHPSYYVIKSLTVPLMKMNPVAGTTAVEGNQRAAQMEAEAGKLYDLLLLVAEQDAAPGSAQAQSAKMAAGA